VIRPFLPAADLLPYVEAIVSVYNMLGRRDNKYKARIKITLLEHGPEALTARIEERFAQLRREFRGADRQMLARIRRQFAPPPFAEKPLAPYEAARAADPVFRAWTDTNLTPHRRADHAIVTVSLKAPGATPGDATSAQMRLLAELAGKYGHDELRISHEQNIILPHVHRADLPALHAALRGAGLATANIGLASDIIACPGMDYCALATARSIPVARDIAARIGELKLEHEIGPLKIRISGCINACGHHHVGHIGILGLNRAGVENYQITLGGDGTENFAIGKRAGPGFAHDEIVPAVERLVRAYLHLRRDRRETFIETFRRLGPAPFRAALYPGKEKANAA
jgi:sulfite reductase (NADPH) hemoprotein beta-component